MNIQVGDVLQMKKTHPCGGENGWCCGWVWTFVSAAKPAGEK